MTQTVCALLTPHGRGAVAVVAVAGSDAVKFLDEHFNPVNGKLFSSSSKKITYGIWNSTGEDLVVYRRDGQHFEVHCHGGNVASQAVIDSFEKANIHLVPAGELLSRFGNRWRLSVQTALSKTATKQTAILVLRQLNLIPAAIKEIIALIDSDSIPQAITQTESLLAWSDFGIHLIQPRSIVLCGRPNVGKSSLINAIVGFHRAIVHDVAGTTRDVVSQQSAIDGWPVILKDTAGLREADNRIEALGIEKAKSQIESADVTICVFDQSTRWNPDDSALIETLSPDLIVHNKSDLSVEKSSDRPDGISTSVELGQGIEELITQIGRQIVTSTPNQDQPIPVSQSQVKVLETALECLKQSNIRDARNLISAGPA